MSYPKRVDASQYEVDGDDDYYYYYAGTSLAAGERLLERKRKPRRAPTEFL